MAKTPMPPYVRTPGQEKAPAFVYAANDASKAHVDPKTVPVGTPLVYVSPFGREIPFTNTAPITKDKAALTAAWAAAEAANVEQ